MKRTRSTGRADVNRMQQYLLFFHPKGSTGCCCADCCKSQAANQASTVWKLSNEETCDQSNKKGWTSSLLGLNGQSTIPDTKWQCMNEHTYTHIQAKQLCI